MLEVCIVYAVGFGSRDYLVWYGIVYAKQCLLPSCFIGANVEFELRLP